VYRFTHFASNLHTKRCIDTFVSEKAKTSYILRTKRCIDTFVSEKAKTSYILERREYITACKFEGIVDPVKYSSHGLAL
jgi:hypothetical protein